MRYSLDNFELLAESYCSRPKHYYFERQAIEKLGHQDTVSMCMVPQGQGECSWHLLLPVGQSVLCLDWTRVFVPESIDSQSNL
jgi:hypothetical protein